jgi:hypothetical protein
MKRDFNLIREILFQVEKATSSEPMQTVAVEEGVDEAVIGEHLEIMIKAGLIEGEVISRTPLCFVITNLTWAGHDFLENALNDNIWRKVMAEAKAKGTSVTMTVLNGLLSKAAEKYAGL